jgi:hypothetical protein
MLDDGRSFKGRVMKKALPLIWGISLATASATTARAEENCSVWQRPVGTGYLEATNKCHIGTTPFEEVTACYNADGSVAATFTPPLYLRFVS